MKKWLWLAATAFVILGLFILMETVPGYFGKQYTESDEFKMDYAYYTDSLITYELAPPDAEELADRPVTQSEIEEYRNRYGSLAEQVENIQSQYAADIEEAKAAKNEDVEKILLEERDRKIAAIQSNFSDNEVVEGKIKDERQEEIANSLRDLNANKPAFNADYAYYAYELKNTETGEVFTKGELSENPVFEKNYTAARPLSDREPDYFVPVLYGAVNEATFEGVIQIDRELLAASDSNGSFNQFNFIKSVTYLLSIAVAGVMIAVMMFLPFRWEWFTFSPLFEKWTGWRMEWRLLTAFLTVVYALFAAGNFNTSLMNSWSTNYASYGLSLGGEFIVALAVTALAILQVIWLAAYYKTPALFKQEFQKSVIHRNVKGLKQVFLNKSIGVQSLVLLTVIFFWGFGTMMSIIIPGILLVWLPATLFIGIPVLVLMLKRFSYLNVLMQETEAMARGQLNQAVPIRGSSPLANHARQLNRLKEGVKISMSEQAKSERLKTELITNVSHDLRTPLTSIITYTDLLKAPVLSDEERLSYAGILDRKSQRLKTLIEDLFEVSKMASGNIELHRSKLDFAQLLQQALAEHAEDIEQSGLDFRVSIGDKPLYIYADGQKWWRMLDNLILNSLKYALPGTRVFVSLNGTGGEAEFIIKNITRYELGENPDELFERFKRGDASRQTEGSGLGLAIAQSIVDLHGGALKIEVDGDLFKVTVTIKSA
ncbi:histidine kinase dimerization/phospho-acceptor domain-containing protein [Planococcus sp. APC 3906]|uniref:histidine kinase dimerization/phospho-acceptor domain-containing protein n=1 Tax=Planococcus sp. APC 3906 TaxID=3035194 RepID=UPI0025B2A5BC|nr:histidine kinase dimerization/phospho-acceptor domain-containing protein [Planococcus sp. APC 3906]MDN3448765.1 histidine kinase dimerization/phospho-acceptor domain-containing protein [Planococcus sp. APC 3906]